MNSDIQVFFDKLVHAHKAQIINLFEDMVASNPDLETNIKWNAPNFVKNNVDCVTFRLFPNDCLQIILHRGVKTKDTQDFQFEDSENLAKWATLDRGILDFLKAPELNSKKIDLINKWISEL